MTLKLKKYLDHLERFIGSTQLFSLENNLWVAVSGGVDSMVLTFLLEKLKERGLLTNLYGLHFNHGLRKESESEEHFVKNYFDDLGVELRVGHWQKKFSNEGANNFESQARHARYEFFSSQMGKRDLLATGHHINDSWEWSLMQSFRSSDIKKTLGIPLKRGRIIRPLMALTRAQILNLAKHYKIPFVQDLSNFDTRFERNYIRQQLCPTILNRYPQALVHYVRSHNDLAKQWGKSAYQPKFPPHSRPEPGIAPLEWVIWRHQGAWCFKHRDGRKHLKGAERIILRGIYALNPGGRGKIAGEIEKICNKSRFFKGPHSFSGGVKLKRIGTTFYLYR